MDPKAIAELVNQRIKLMLGEQMIQIIALTAQIEAARKDAEAKAAVEE